MTASLQSDVQAVFDRFVTTEFTTIDQRGQPITWPVTPYYTPGAPCIDVSAALGYPKEANDARPIRWSPCCFRIRPAAACRRRRSCSCRDRPRSMTVISTRTASVTNGSRSRSCPGPRRSTRPWDPRIAELGTRYPTAVLSIVSPDGFPFAIRTPVAVDEANRWIRIASAPSDAPLQGTAKRELARRS